MLGAAIHLVRLARAGYVLAREGVFADVDPLLVPAQLRLPLLVAKLLGRRNAQAGHRGLVAAIAKLGPSYVKLGQFLATRPDVVGPHAARDLERLQDRMQPFGRDIAIGIIEASFGRPLSSIYAEFGEPVAAASIAQVHRARVRDAEGEREVAVKVVRPGIERRFARDLADMFFAARLFERWAPDARRLRPVEVVDTLARSVRMETDFRIEAAAASEFAENTAADTDFRVPKVDWDRTEKDVLTLEWVDGTPLSDMAGLVKTGFDLPRLGRTVIQSFLRHAMRDGFFHADMHPGNLLIDRDGRLAAVDFGIMGRLDLRERRFLAEILYGFITRDYRRVAEVHFEAGYVPERYRVEDFAQAVRAIGEPIHARTADQISMARLLTLLFEVTALFDMHTRTELVMLQKTMVVVEGVGRMLDPRLDMWGTAEPVVRQWIEANLGPVGKFQDARGNLAVLGRAMLSLPDMLTRAERITRRLDVAIAEGFALAPSAIEALGRAEAMRARVGHIALWVIAAAIVWIAIRWF